MKFFIGDAPGMGNHVRVQAIRDILPINSEIIEGDIVAANVDVIDNETIFNGHSKNIGLIDFRGNYYLPTNAVIRQEFSIARRKANGKINTNSPIVFVYTGCNEYDNYVEDTLRCMFSSVTIKYIEPEDTVWDIIKKMNDSHFGIVKSGLTLCECMCLGLPTVSFATTKYEFIRGSELHDKGGTIFTDLIYLDVGIGNLTQMVTVESEELKVSELLCRIGKNIIDGRGVFRVAAELMSKYD